MQKLSKIVDFKSVLIIYASYVSSSTKEKQKITMDVACNLLHAKRNCTTKPQKPLENETKKSYLFNFFLSITYIYAGSHTNSLTTSIEQWMTALYSDRTVHYY